MERKHRHPGFVFVLWLTSCLFFQVTTVPAAQLQDNRSSPEKRGNTGNAQAVNFYQQEISVPKTSTLIEMKSIDAIKAGLIQDEERDFDIADILPHPTATPAPTVLGNAVTNAFVLGVWAKLLYDLINGK